MRRGRQEQYQHIKHQQKLFECCCAFHAWVYVFMPLLISLYFQAFQAVFSVFVCALIPLVLCLFYSLFKGKGCCVAQLKRADVENVDSAGEALFRGHRQLCGAQQEGGVSLFVLRTTASNKYLCPKKRESIVCRFECPSIRPEVLRCRCFGH